MARAGLLDVHRHERRFAPPGSRRSAPATATSRAPGRGGRTFLASPLSARRPPSRAPSPTRGSSCNDPGAFHRLESRTAVIPARTSTPTRSSRALSQGHDAYRAGRHLFAGWRYDESGQPRPDFPLSRPEAHGARVLVAARTSAAGPPGARSLGAAGLRVPRGDQLVDRRHLPRQRAQERPPSGDRRPGQPSSIAGSPGCA